MILGSAYDNPQTMDEQHRFALAFLQQQNMNAAAMHNAVDHAAAVSMHSAASSMGNPVAGWSHLNSAQPQAVVSGSTSLVDTQGRESLGASGGGMLPEDARKAQLQEILQQIMTITEQSLDAAQAR